MAEYRLYSLGRDGRFMKTHDIVAENDDEAIAKARSLQLQDKCELWERDRLVAELPSHWS